MQATLPAIRGTLPALHQLQAVICDFDGVLTDNRVYTDQDGRETVCCNRADGWAIALLRQAGIRSFIVSTETNPVVSARGAKLKVPVIQGCADKAAALTTLEREHGLDLRRCLYLGNDTNDLPAIQRCGYSACPADAVAAVKQVAGCTLSAVGGAGVVREVAERLGLGAAVPVTAPVAAAAGAAPATALRLDFPGVQTRLLPAEADYITQLFFSATTLTMGPELRQLEQDFVRYLGGGYAVGLNSCTAALELAAILSGVKAGDEVIVPAHTFTASALPFLRLKAKLVFADIDPHTLVISAASVAACITPRTKAIVPVHLYGLPAPMPEIMALAARHSLYVIEDVAQAPGAAIDGRLVGTWGDAACFSFHSQKNINALGEGGLLLLRDQNAYEAALGLRKIGSRPFKGQTKYWQPAMSNIVEAVPGVVPFNFALAEPNAAAARLILQRLEAINDNRRQQAASIQQALADFPELQFQQVPGGYRHAYHLLVARYVATHSDRNALIDLLYTTHRIKCVVQYYPLYNYELFQRHGYSERVCPEADRFFDAMISFPFWSSMPAADVDYLVSAVQQAIRSLRGKG